MGNSREEYKTLYISRHVPLSGHADVALLNDVANYAESIQKKSSINTSYSLV